MKVYILLVCAALSVASTTNNKVLNIPEDVMSFLLNCDGRFAGKGPEIPVASTKIDTVTGEETKEFTMMNIKQLRQSLVDTVESDEVVGRILAQVEQSLEGKQVPKGKRRNQQCTTVKVELPKQEVTGLSEQLQAVIQQNNYQLLEQINTLFAFKLNSFYKDMEELFNAKLAELGANLVMMQHQQVEKEQQQQPAHQEELVPIDSPVLSIPGNEIEEAAVLSSEPFAEERTSKNEAQFHNETPEEEYTRSKPDAQSETAFEDQYQEELKEEILQLEPKDVYETEPQAEPETEPEPKVEELEPEVIDSPVDKPVKREEISKDYDYEQGEVMDERERNPEPILEEEPTPLADRRKLNRRKPLKRSRPMLRTQRTQQRFRGRRPVRYPEEEEEERQDLENSAVGRGRKPISRVEEPIKEGVVDYEEEPAEEVVEEQPLKKDSRKTRMEVAMERRRKLMARRRPG